MVEDVKGVGFVVIGLQLLLKQSRYIIINTSDMKYNTK
jgi:hypothetical protein